MAGWRMINMNAFLTQDLPTRKNEYWKYDDLSFLANQHYATAKKVHAKDLEDVICQHRLRSGDSVLMVLVNGYFMPELSDLTKIREHVIACNMSEALQHHAESVRENMPDNINVQKYPFANLNAANFTDGLFLKIPDNCELNTPIHLLSLIVSDQAFITHPRHMFLLGKNSSITLVEEYFSQENIDYMMNVVTTIHADKNAKLQHYKIQHEGKKAAHFACHFVQQKQNSYYLHVNVSTGAQFARDDVVVQLSEAGAECYTSGFYHLRNDNQSIDNHVDIQHAAPHSNSDMLYKGIMENKSRAIFNGRLHVEKDAQKILAYQANHNLLLSNTAEVYSKPELEIYADDVKCKHGATTGQLDEDALFYLRARGIPKDEALNMLLQAFAEEIMQRVTHEGIRMRVEESL